MKWVKRISRAMMMGFAWAAVWVPMGALAGAIYAGELEPEHIGGPLYASVIAGSIFSAVAGTASGRRKLRDLSVLQSAARGAATGALVGVLPFLLGDTHGEPIPGYPAWMFALALIGSLTLLCAVSAVTTVWLAKTISRDTKANAI